MESATPDAAKSFARGLDAIVESLEKGEYRGCFHNAMDLTRFSWMLGQNDWIFLCEVLESVYANMADLVERKAVSGDAESGMRKMLRTGMDAVIESHRGGDRGSRYAAQRDLRANATDFQLGALSGYRRAG